MQIKQALLLNSIFSFSSAVLMLIFNSQLQILFWFKQIEVFIAIALWLLSFVALILYVTYRKITNKKWVQAITWMDFIWVIVSILLIILNPFWITSIWNIYIWWVALIVAIMWFLQYSITKTDKKKL